MLKKNPTYNYSCNMVKVVKKVLLRKRKEKNLNNRLVLYKSQGLKQKFN